MATTEGFGRGLVVADYPESAEGIPLLTSFYFRFDKGSGGPVDNWLNIIRVMPPGDKQDLSPTADLPLDTTAAGKIDLMYADRKLDSGKDNYFYKAAHVPHSARRFQLRDVGCTGSCERVLQIPGVNLADHVFVLVGFQLFFTGGRDHHMDEIAVFEESGKLIVKFNDKNDDDVFGYFVDFALVRRRPGTVIRTGEESGRAKGAARIPLPEGTKYICGFHFDYVTNDHHIREVGALMRPNDLEVYYGDRNGDDPFNYNVKWATIRPLVNAVTP
jgi:hypothetical protein